MSASHAAWVRQLYREYEAIVYHFGLPAMRAVLQVAPLTRHWGLWDPTTRSITLGTRLIEAHGWDVVVEVLKHEMAHQWAGMHAPDEAPHGDAFARACRLLAVAPWAAGCSGALPMTCVPGGHRQVSPQEQRLLDKVEKLLSLASSPNEHEAALAMQRARHMLTRYNLERVTAAPQASDDLTYTVVHRKRRRSCRIEGMVVALLVEHFDVQAVHTTLFDPAALCEYRAVELMGEHRHVALAEYVYHFLLQTLQTLYERYRRERQGPGRQRASFMVGVMMGFAEKLAADAEADARAIDGEAKKTGTALVRMQKKQLRAYMDRRHPKLRSRSLKTGKLEANALHAGKKAGRDIVLHRAISGQTRQRGHLLPTRC